MYNEFFGLQRTPFGMTADESLLYMTASHCEALAGVTYGILQRKGFILLTGDAGTGKTTLLRHVLRRLSASRIQSSVILSPSLNSAEFLEMALLDFGLTTVPDSKARRLIALKDLLLEGRAAGKISVLVVDEAHTLKPEVLEEIRLLGNFDYADEKLLQILLIGQNELAGTLDRHELRQLKQRFAVRLSINPLRAAEVSEYIAFRWRKAGAAGPPPFSKDAVEALANCSEGIPRVINVICDTALMAAFGSGLKSVELRHVTEACADLRVGRGAAPVSARPRTEAAPVVELPRLRTLDRYETSETKRSKWIPWGKPKFAETR